MAESFIIYLKNNKVSCDETICLCWRQFNWSIAMVQPPSEHLWTTAGDGTAVLATSSGMAMDTPTSGHDFQHGVSY